MSNTVVLISELVDGSTLSVMVIKNAETDIASSSCNIEYLFSFGLFFMGVKIVWG